MRRRKDRRAPGRREDAQAGGRLQRVVGVGVGRIVEAQLLQQRDVNRVRVGMKELGAEIDGEALPLVVDHVRIAVTADLGSRLEQVDVEGAGEKVGRSHAARTGADDGHAVSIRSRPAVPVRLAGEAAAAAASRPASTEPAPSVAKATAPLTTSRRVIDEGNPERSLIAGHRI